MPTGVNSPGSDGPQQSVQPSSAVVGSRGKRSCQQEGEPIRDPQESGDCKADRCGVSREIACVAHKRKLPRSPASVDWARQWDERRLHAKQPTHSVIEAVLRGVGAGRDSVWVRGVAVSVATRLSRGRPQDQRGHGDFPAEERDKVRVPSRLVAVSLKHTGRTMP
jgi:hypothetical protein